MNDFSTLKAKIKTILQSETTINVVYDYDRPNIEKSPAAMVVPSGNDSDYVSTVHNRRSYAFVVKVMVPLDPAGMETAESTLVGIIDSLIDKFDQDFTLTGSCLMMTAAPSAWGYEEREILYRVATINLKCKTNFNVT